MPLRTIGVETRGHAFILRYEAGEEPQVIDEVMRLAEDPTGELDWADAALLGLQISYHAARDGREPVTPATGQRAT